MEEQLAFEETCERYLLGELSEAERERFEADYFADDELFQRFLAVKEELLDLYARGELAGEKRSRFEEHFLATAPRRRRLNDAQEFIRAVTAVSTKAATDDATLNAALEVETKKTSRKSFTNFFNLRPFAWQFALAAIILVSLFGVWLFFRSGQQTTPDELASGQPTPAPTTAPTTAPPTNESESTNADNNTAPPPSPTPANVNQSSENTNTAPQPTPKKTPVQPPQISPAQIASVMLLPVASRDINEANTLRLNPDTRTIRLSLVFKSDDYRNYSAAIGTIAGATVWQQKTLKASTGGGNKSVTLQFAPALLRGQDYIVTLKGQTAGGQAETIGEYYFRVERSSSQNTPITKP